MNTFKPSTKTAFCVLYNRSIYPNSVVEIDVRDASENDTDKEKWLNEFEEWMSSLDADTPNLTDEQISRESIYEEQIQRQL